jgi:hypothetical protein
MNNPIIWIHGDCLSPKSPALQEYPDTPAIWVWDEKLLDKWQISLKRIVFIYECLLELPVVIRRGKVSEEVLAFAAEHNADGVLTMDSPSPRFEAICDQIEEKLPIEIWEGQPLVDYDGYIDLKRFSRYWKKAKPYALKSHD